MATTKKASAKPEAKKAAPKKAAPKKSAPAARKIVAGDRVMLNGHEHVVDIAHADELLVKSLAGGVRKWVKPEVVEVI